MDEQGGGGRRTARSMQPGRNAGWRAARSFMATTLSQLRSRIDAIESCYEFMLAYAAQGLPADTHSPVSGQLRELLTYAAEAMDGLADAFRDYVAQNGNSVGSVDRYMDFVRVLERDAESSLAAIRLALAQPGISSQLVDNLNALIHLRALLTDLFVLDEILPPAEGAPSGSH